MSLRTFGSTLFKGASVNRPVKNLQEGCQRWQRMCTSTHSHKHLNVETCLFCKIIAGKIPSLKIYENDKVLSFMDVSPLSYGHCLVIPKVPSSFCVRLDKLYLTIYAHLYTQYSFVQNVPIWCRWTT